MANFAGDGHLAAVRLGDGLADGKAETSAALIAIAGRVGAVETIEEMGQMLGGDPWALIRDRGE